MGTCFREAGRLRNQKNGVKRGSDKKIKGESELPGTCSSKKAEGDLAPGITALDGLQGTIIGLRVSLPVLSGLGFVKRCSFYLELS
jgi:hypothetical protein